MRPLPSPFRLRHSAVTVGGCCSEEHSATQPLPRWALLPSGLLMANLFKPNIGALGPVVARVRESPIHGSRVLSHAVAQ